MHSETASEIGDLGQHPCIWVPFCSRCWIDVTSNLMGSSLAQAALPQQARWKSARYCTCTQQTDSKMTSLAKVNNFISVRFKLVERLIKSCVPNHNINCPHKLSTMGKVTSLEMCFLCLPPNLPLAFASITLIPLSLGLLHSAWARTECASSKMIVGFRLLWTYNLSVSCYEAIRATEKKPPGQTLSSGCVWKTFLCDLKVVKTKPPRESSWFGQRLHCPV